MQALFLFKPFNNSTKFQFSVTLELNSLKASSREQYSTSSLTRKDIVKTCPFQEILPYPLALENPQKLTSSSWTKAAHAKGTCQLLPHFCPPKLKISYTVSKCKLYGTGTKMTEMSRISRQFEEGKGTIKEVLFT